MLFVRAAIIFTCSILGVAQGQVENCPSNDNGQCDFEPTNPYSCGTSFNCAYKNRCLAEAAGFDIEADCCQAPQPSACTADFSPVQCGSKQCPYANQCVASLAGYNADQCTAPPPTCPTGEKDCSGEPSNPYTCGPNQCSYSTICDLESAGFDLRNDCCQDSRSNSACSSNIAPVSCGPPGGKQCGYSNQCLADSSGYNSNQCCNAVPDGVACASIAAPVECGSIPCVYNSICEAEAAGATDCCAQVPSDTICTGENTPVKCGSCEYANQCLADAAGATGCCNAVPDGVTCASIAEPVTCGANQCAYNNQCEADAAGATECCRNPVDEGCAQNYDPLLCGRDSCEYVNECVAKKSGFDPSSCVLKPSPSTMATDGIASAPSGSNIVAIEVGCLTFTIAAMLAMIM